MGNIIKKKIIENKSQDDFGTFKFRTVVANCTVPEGVTEKEHPNRKYCSNRITTTKYTFISFLPKNLFEQFHRFANLYFLFIVLLNWIPQVNALGKEVAMLPVLFVLAVTGVKDGYEDYRRYRSDKRINQLKSRIYDRVVGAYVLMEWASVKVGDFVHMSCNEVIPADILLLNASDPHGLCYIETSNLDGESNLKERRVVPGFSNGEAFSPTQFTQTVECDLPRREINRFHGYILKENGDKISVSRHNILLRGCVLRNTDFVEGLVVYAGHESKALLNNRGPRYKRSQLERRMNRDVVMCMLVLCVMCFFCAIGSGVWLDQFTVHSHIPYLPHSQSDDWSPLYQTFIVFWTYIILYQVVIPVSLYVSIEIVKLGQAYFITHDKELYHEETNTRAQCRALNITEDLGQVEFVFSDKTGTLTENKMEFRCCSIGGVNYPHVPENQADEDTNESKSSNSSLYSSQSSVCNFTPEPGLLCDIAKMSTASLSGYDTSVPVHRRRIHEFFLLLTICNTVMVTKHGHHDQMNNDAAAANKEHLAQATPRPPDFSINCTSSSPTSTPPGKRRPIFKSVYPSSQHDSSNPPVSTPHSTLHKAHRVLLGNKGVAPLDVTHPGDLAASSIQNVPAAEQLSQVFEGVYEAESPDELALVRAAAKYGCRLLHRTSTTVTVWLPGEGQVTYDLLQVLEFDSVRKRMSVIVRCPLTNNIVLYCKGADNCVMNRLKDTEANLIVPEMKSGEDAWIFDNTKDHLTHYAKNGLRTLCMAKRVFSLAEYSSWLVHYHAAQTSLEDRENLVFTATCNAENHMELLGVTGIEDRLQDGVSETIRDLRRAGMTVWVLTGDKEETALNVAYSCGLISFDQQLLTINSSNMESAEAVLSLSLTSVKQRSLQNQARPVADDINDSDWLPSTKAAMLIEGRSLKHALEKPNLKKFIDLIEHCTSVICCRTTPHQKANVVRMVRDKMKKLTLSIGDGANDVSMIQTADVGIGISGQEGMQAVMASDFAIARFRFLKRLLLVHGHWSYYRLAVMTLYMFYKNSVYVLMIFWYQIFNGFSGSYMMNQVNLLIFNTIYTSLPPLIVGMFDQNVDAETLMDNPKLYKESQKSLR